ncbi:MAG TPA: glutamate--tRNA ligase [Rhizomicrobium sp.]|jgi:glutamyl-tRNA synthetase|nr:glutamate--tRNA ligase [Rhizomicrobium sp.]
MAEDSTPVLRFAPSPTGYLHIGGARTALFNWLYARHAGGRFLLRIEDTDRERSTPQAVQAILGGLSWLGLNWDGEPLFQFARAERHREVAEELLRKGRAYRCYATPEELTRMREEQRASGKPQRYDGRWRDRDPRGAPVNAPFVIRLKAPQEGETIVNDLVQGEVRFANAQLDDMILLRSDGTPTYMLAVVVDDYDMGVTHVIRGDDHLNNAARQLQIIESMGWPRPIYGHVPLIHGPDGTKLSKRHGALAVEAYRDMGYLPEAMRNYLLRLGWSHGNEEIIPTKQAIEWFDLANIGRSPARLDFKKFDNLNAHYMRALDDAALTEQLVSFLRHTQPEREIDHAAHARITAAMPGLKDRAKTLVELAQAARFLFRNGAPDLDAQAEKILSPEARQLLAELMPILQRSEWHADALEAEVRALAESKAVKLGQIAQPLRAALTGKSASPPIFDVMVVLGREETLLRIGEVAG